MDMPRVIRHHDRMSLDALIEKHGHRPDRHITRVMGCFVVVADGAVIEVDRTDALSYCPLQSMLGDPDVAAYIEGKIRKFGQFTAHREIVRDSFGVPFGTSEMFMRALQAGVLDAAVVVCDGAGTVVSARPEVVQGIGARMNGVFHTSPIPEIQRKLRERDGIVFDGAPIDQLRGLRAAAAAGYARVGVTVNAFRGESLCALRETARDTGLDVTVAALCATGAGAQRARQIAEHADLAWSCASQHVRAYGREAILQITHGIPIFVHTARGMRIVAAYADEPGRRAIEAVKPGRQYLLSSRPPGAPVRLGETGLWLSETRLPVAGKHAPRPLR